MWVSRMGGFEQLSCALIRDEDAGAAGERAFVLADAAADAHVGDDVGVFDHAFRSVGSGRLAPLEPDRLVGNGAVFLADEAVLVAPIGDAEVLVEHRPADGVFVFCVERQLPDGTGRAYVDAFLAFAAKIMHQLGIKLRLIFYIFIFMQIFFEIL